MNSLKTMFVVAVLAAVAFGVYTTINDSPVPPPPGVSGDWAGGPPSISLSEPDVAPGFSVGLPGTGIAAGTAAPFPPSTLAGGDGLTAPPFAQSAPLPTEISGVGLPPTPFRAGSGAAEPARSPFAEFLQSARQDLDDGKLAETLAKLSAFYGDLRLSEEESRELNELLDQVAGTVIYSTEHWLEPAYQVKQGDTLESIAEHHRVPAPLLAKINGIDPAQPLSPGRQIKVLEGPFNAVIHLDRCEMTLMLQDRYAGRFPIGIGGDQPQLQGSHAVLEKQINPTYYGPTGVIDADNPNNPLGERMLGLGGKIAIHGTNNPAYIGTANAQGTICLAPQDAENVYDILSVGSRVVIRR